MYDNSRALLFMNEHISTCTLYVKYSISFIGHFPIVLGNLGYMYSIMSIIHVVHRF